MAEVPEQEATGSNRRVWFVVGIVVLIVLYLVARSIEKRITIGGLSSEDGAVRTRSAQKLDEMKILTDVLSRQTVPVKRKMISTFREMNTESAADQLIALMKDRNPTVQNEAQFALYYMKPTSVAKLVGALSNADLNVKNRAAAALVNIGPAVLEPVEKDGKKSVPLIDAVATPAARGGVTRVATSVGSGATPWLMEKLSDEAADAGTKGCAIDILGRLNAKEAGKAIRDMLNAEKVDAPVRAAVLVALARLHHPDAYGLLIAALADPDQSVVNTAIVGLGELRDPKTVAVLEKYLYGFDESLRDAGVAALSKIGVPAVPALAGLLKNDRYEVRVGALRALQGIEDPRTTGIIASALKDKDENVRRMAAEALGRANDGRCVAPLVSALSDPAWRVADRARDSLITVGAPAVPALVANLGQASGSMASFYTEGALKKIGSAAVNALMNTARQGSTVARQRAVMTLGEIADPRSASLLQTLSTTASVPALRQAAERALKQVREGRRLS